MRKNGWQLPYHPLQVVAVAVFLALGFAFYVFFAPFVGKRLFQYIVMGIYTPLIISVLGLYIWCAASDPADSGVFKSRKYLNFPDSKKHTRAKESKLGGESTSSIHEANAAITREKTPDKGMKDFSNRTECDSTEIEKNELSSDSSCFMGLLAFLPCAFMCNCSSRREESSELQMSEDGMFYCSLCEVEVNRYSKHCRVCDKCVDRFDHHCRWLNNCIGKKNYRQFFTLMVSALLLLILQWSVGIEVLICCFLERNRFSVDIASKLGSSFSVAPFVIVVGMCTILAMIATLPLAQLFFFHILLMKKGISTYDYIIALREQEQQEVGQQSPQMSQASSRTGFSSVSSFNTFHRGSWCTPPRLFFEDQFDVVPPDTGSVSSLGKKTAIEEPIKKKKPAAVKISPWTLARLNAEEVSKVASEARKKSKILQPVVRRESPVFGTEIDTSFASIGLQTVPRLENSNRRRVSKRARLQSLTKFSAKEIPEPSMSLAPLRLEARSAFQTSLAMSGSAGIVSSSPESNMESPDLHPFRVSLSGAEEAKWFTGLSGSAEKGMNMVLSRSTSDGYEASGGEDSDRVPSSSYPDERVARLKALSSSFSVVNKRKL